MPGQRQGSIDGTVFRRGLHDLEVSPVDLRLEGGFRLEPDIGDPGFLALDNRRGILDDRVATMPPAYSASLSRSRCLIAVLFQSMHRSWASKGQNAASSFRLVVLRQ